MAFSSVYIDFWGKMYYNKDGTLYVVHTNVFRFAAAVICGNGCRFSIIFNHH